MVIIIAEERFLSLSLKCSEQYLYLREKFPEDLKFKKLKRVIVSLKVLYKKDKVYAVKYLNYLEKYQMHFTEERRALVVQLIELLQKLILHKKLQKPEC